MREAKTKGYVKGVNLVNKAGSDNKDDEQVAKLTVEIPNIDDDAYLALKRFSASEMVVVVVLPYQLIMNDYLLVKKIQEELDILKRDHKQLVHDYKRLMNPVVFQETDNPE